MAVVIHQMTQKNYYTDYYGENISPSDYEVRYDVHTAAVYQAEMSVFCQERSLQLPCPNTNIICIEKCHLHTVYITTVSCSIKTNPKKIANFIVGLL